MEFSVIDISVFVLFVVCVVGVGLWKSRKEKTSEDYFLAGRGLVWPLIGFSLIAANISTEQFVGMNGSAASHVGLAIASYEWMAAVTLVIVAFGFLPYFLRAGIYTMPEFLEYRYNSSARIIMAIATMFIYMLLLGAVTYSGALTIKTLAGKMEYSISLEAGSLVIGIIAMLYVTAGGLKACAWADLIQGSALIIGGIVIMVFAFMKLGQASEATTIVDVETGKLMVKELAEGVGPIERYWDLNKVRMNMILPSTDKVLPCTALLLGLWIPNFYYWGLNQYITQRTLGSSSLAQGQKGIVFSAFMKLLIPFAIVVPGIIAFNLFSKDMQQEAVFDNASIMAKYQQANPETKFVEVALSPDPAAVTNWPAGRYMIAVYATDEALKEATKDIKAINPFVLPITQKDYDGIEVAEFTVFKSDDKAFSHVNPELALEIEAFNGMVEENAAKAGGLISTEKPISYKYDTALAQLLGQVLPQGVGLIGFVLAALLGAVVSSLAAMLNAASTIFSMDVYKKYISPEASQKALVLLGRICVIVFTFIAVMLAPRLGDPKISNSIFTIIQESQGFISPGILAVFVCGLLIHKAPPMAGVIGLLANIVSYGAIKLAFPNVQFLNRMAICFGFCILIIILITLVKPLAAPVEFKQNINMDLKPSKGAKAAGIIVILLTIVLYILFSPLGLIR
ncbi:MAG: sodium/solute symporter [Sedimentisphaerales bacterium]|nr:sodium/solute symporter [Sedimentisphaerales bacterium]